MTKKLLTSVAIAALLGACTTAAGPGRSTTPATSPGDESPSVDAEATAAIDLPHLPPQGVVVERQGGIVFVTLDGRVLAKVHGVQLANGTEAPGAILLQRGSEWFVLDVAGSILLPIERERADRLHETDGHAIHLPTPPGMFVNGAPVGHWRFALLSPDGNRILAQWSGECEVPRAYVVTLQSGPPVPVTGDASVVPESFALGWTRGDRALVVLPTGSCASGTERPGVYAFDVSGRASLITTVPRIGSARMWGNR